MKATLPEFASEIQNTQKGFAEIPELKLMGLLKMKQTEIVPTGFKQITCYLVIKFQVKNLLLH